MQTAIRDRDELDGQQEQQHARNDSIHYSYLLLHVILCALLSMGTFSPLMQISTASIALILLVLFFEPLEQSLYLIIMLAPFENLIAINGRKIFFAVFLVFLIKTLIKKPDVRGKNIVCLFFSVALVGIELFNNFTLATISYSPYAIFNTSFYLLFYFCIIRIIDDCKLSIKTIILSFNISILIVIIVTFNTYGSFGAFIDKAREANYVFRLGNTTFDTLGGAMGIPLYSSLVVAMNVVYLTLKKTHSILMNILLLAMITLSATFGVLSVSRSFYLCFFVFAGSYFVISLLQKKKSFFSLIALMVAIAAISIFFTSSSFTWILENLSYRFMDEDTGTGIRGEIWMSCIDFLYEHPFRLLVGTGSNCYDQYGANTNQLFSLTAHNFILDIIMSFGLVGFSMLIYMFNQLLRKLRDGFGKIRSTFAVLPFITLMTFGVTALRTATGKTWIYFVLTVLFMYAMRDEYNELNS